MTMSEATVINLFLVGRVLLVGGILLILPRFMRKGLLFGAYVGEAMADEDAAQDLLGNWNRGCLLVMASALLVGLGISVAGHPVTGNLTGTGVLLLGALVLYLRVYSRARALAPPVAAQQAAKASAPLVGGEPTRTSFAKVALGFCILASLAAYAYAVVSYKGMTGSVSSLDSPRSDMPFFTIIFVPSLNLMLSPILALMALLTANAKRSVRGGSGGGSVEAQNAFRATMTNLLSWAALLVCAFLTLLSVQVVRIGVSDVRSLGAVTLLLAGVVILFLFGNLIRIVKRYGQGGALLERGTVEAPLTNGLADNTHWVWGLFYVDRDDPSIMVEKRFGIGYALNWGNRTAVLIVAAFVVLCLSLTTVALLGTLIGGG
jgi:uncharacterized membrane protein